MKTNIVLTIMAFLFYCTTNAAVLTEESYNNSYSESSNELQLLVDCHQQPEEPSLPPTCAHPKNECIGKCIKQRLKGGTADESGCRSLSAFCDVFCGGW